MKQNNSQRNILSQQGVLITKTENIKPYRSRSQFDLIINNQIKKNEYDYKKMMDDFELEARRRKMQTNIRNKWKEKNKLYMEKIEEMKLKNERLYKERDRKFKQKLQKKEASIQKQIELKNEKLLENKKRSMELSKKKVMMYLKIWRNITRNRKKRG